MFKLISFNVPKKRRRKRRTATSPVATVPEYGFHGARFIRRTVRYIVPDSATMQAPVGNSQINDI